MMRDDPINSDVVDMVMIVVDVTDVAVTAVDVTPAVVFVNT